MKPLKFTILNGTYCIHRLKRGTALPAALFASPFYNITQSEDELSVVAPIAVKLDAQKTDGGWAVMKVNGPLDFSEIGILAGISTTLAQEGISIFAISTFDTDYILVKELQLRAAKEALIAAGHRFARITLASQDSSRALFLPLACIQRRSEGDAAVYVVDSARSQVFEQRVSLGTIDGESVEVLSGLHEGALVATQGVAKLHDAARISLGSTR